MFHCPSLLPAPTTGSANEETPVAEKKNLEQDTKEIPQDNGKETK